MTRTISVCVCLAVAMLAAGTSRAHSQMESAPIPTEVDQGVKRAIVTWAASVAADQITTYRFSSQYGDLLHEQNPLIGGLDRHPVLLVAAGTAIDATTGWAAYRLLGRRHPRLAKIAFYGATAYRSYLVAYNVQMMRRAQQVRAMASSKPATLPR